MYYASDGFHGGGDQCNNMDNSSCNSMNYRKGYNMTNYYNKGNPIHNRYLFRNDMDILYTNSYWYSNFHNIHTHGMAYEIFLSSKNNRNHIVIHLHNNLHNNYLQYFLIDLQNYHFLLVLSLLLRNIYFIKFS